MSYKLVLKDTFRQIFAKVVSALVGFIVTMLVTRYLGTLRYGDYGTVAQYFVLWTAFADFGLYVIGLKDLGKMQHNNATQEELSTRYSQYVWSRFSMMGVIYALAIIVAYMIPSYTDNIYLVRGLPLGMIYSAMTLGGSMFRMPLQLNWNMKHVSIALFLARGAQVALLLLIILVLAPASSFSQESLPLVVFLGVVSTMLLSAATEFVYTYAVGGRFLRLRKVPFKDFWITFLKGNWQYGFSQFFSGLYVPLLFIVLGWLYPTVRGYEYSGQRYLAATLMSTMRIMSSALGNSMLHKVTNHSIEEQKKNFGSFFLLMLRLGLLVFVNFLVFAKPIIQFIAGNRSGGGSFLTQIDGSIYDAIWYTFNNFSTIDQSVLGADLLLPFFGLVLIVSFIKNMYTYLFVATHHHNRLLKVNALAVLVGFFGGSTLIYHYELLGAVAGQLMYGIVFLLIFAYYARDYKIVPTFESSDLLKILGFFGVVLVAGYFVIIQPEEFWKFIAVAFVFNVATFGLRFKRLKKVAKKLV